MTNRGMEGDDDDGLPESGTPDGLTQAGQVIDKAIEYLAGQNIDEIAVASALLGGAMGVLARSLDDDAIAQILGRAIASLRSGEFRRMDH